nr:MULTISPECIES: TetR family transcriptional regulator [Streptomyces]
MRATVRAEVVEVAHRLFTEQGFDRTTVHQIAAEVVCRAPACSGTSALRKKSSSDACRNPVAQSRRRSPPAPDDERPWEALRRSFDVPTRMNEQASEPGTHLSARAPGDPVAARGPP